MSPAKPTARGGGLPDLQGDPEQLRAFRAGEEELLAALFRASAPKLRSVLYACGLRSAADIDDALQTTFVRAFAPAARQAYSGLSPYESYLKTIARNVVKDLKKSGRARFEVLDPELALAHQDHSPGSRPEAALMQREQEAWRDRFLGGLRPHEREVYLSCVREGLSEREAADRLEISRHKVRAALASLQGRLTRFVKEHRLDE